MKRYLVAHVMDQAGLELLLSKKDELRRFQKIVITHPKSKLNLYLPTKVTNDIVLLPTNNRGRDMYPFREAVKMLNLNSNDILIKWHNKKRNHFTGKKLGNPESKLLLDYLINTQDGRNFEDVVLNEGVSGCAPQGWLLPLSYRLGANKHNVYNFVRNDNLDWKAVLENAWFPAGGLFAIKAGVILNSNWLNSPEKLIEFGFGGLDGTWAHASERFLGVLGSVNGAWVNV